MDHGVYILFNCKYPVVH